MKRKRIQKVLCLLIFIQGLFFELIFIICSVKWTFRSHVSICLLYHNNNKQHKYSVHNFIVHIWPVYSFNTQKITERPHTHTVHSFKAYENRHVSVMFVSEVCACVCCDAIDLILLCRCNYSIHSVELILNGGHSLRQIGRFKWSIDSIWSEWVYVGKGKDEKEEE